MLPILFTIFDIPIQRYRVGGQTSMAPVGLDCRAGRGSAFSRLRDLARHHKWAV